MSVPVNVLWVFCSQASVPRANLNRIQYHLESKRDRDILRLLKAYTIHLMNALNYIPLISQTLQSEGKHELTSLVQLPELVGWKNPSHDAIIFANESSAFEPARYV